MCFEFCHKSDAECLPHYQPGKHGQQQTNGYGAVDGGTASNYSNYTATSTTKVGSSNLEGVSAVGRKIMEFMYSQPQTEQGVHVAAITRAVQKDADTIRCVTVASSCYVILTCLSNALDELMETGNLFSTIDESHFGVSA